jgi:hypothetical protein
MAAHTFIRWARLGVWVRLHRLGQERRGLELGMVFLDGTVIRAHHRERKRLVKERVAHVNRIRTLLATQGLYDHWPQKAATRERLEPLRTRQGKLLPHGRS